MYQLDANNFIMILSHEWPLHISDIYMSIFRWTCKCPKHVEAIHEIES